MHELPRQTDRRVHDAAVERIDRGSVAPGERSVVDLSDMAAELNEQARERLVATYAGNGWYARWLSDDRIEIGRTPL